VVSVETQDVLLSKLKHEFYLITCQTYLWNIGSVGTIPSRAEYYGVNVLFVVGVFPLKVNS
jgi:hypothetical protein